MAKTVLDILRNSQGWLAADTNNAIVRTATSTTVDTYEYKTGGTGGSVVFTIVVTYDNADHDNFLSAVRSV